MCQQQIKWRRWNLWIIGLLISFSWSRLLIVLCLDLNFNLQVMTAHRIVNKYKSINLIKWYFQGNWRWTLHKRLHLPFKIRFWFIFFCDRRTKMRWPLFYFYFIGIYGNHPQYFEISICNFLSISLSFFPSEIKCDNNNNISIQITKKTKIKNKYENDGNDPMCPRIMIFMVTFQNDPKFYFISVNWMEYFLLLKPIRASPQET